MHSIVAAFFRFSTQRLACAAALLFTLAAGPLSAQSTALGLVTLLDAEVSLLRDSSRYALAEGVALRRDDIIETGAKTQITLLAFSDGSTLALGPSTSVQISPRLTSERGKLEARIYLRQGWVKVSAAKGSPWAINSSVFDLSGLTQEAVVALLGNVGQVFAEAGDLSVRPVSPLVPPLVPPLVSGPPQRLSSGEFLALSGAGKPEFARRPPPSFAQSMPRAFQDKLPSRAAAFQGKDIKPNRLAEIAYADAQPWLDAEAALRKANLQRWKPLARLPEFRKGLLAGMKSHPEWEPILLAAQAAPATGASANVGSAVKY